MTGTAALAWFKRDLRVRDHAPLAQAMHFDSALGLVVFEPLWLESPECDPRHDGFLLDCLAELRHGLAARGLPLLVPNRCPAAGTAVVAARVLFHLPHEPMWLRHFAQAPSGGDGGPAVVWGRLMSKCGFATLLKPPRGATAAPPSSGGLFSHEETGPGWSFARDRAVAEWCRTQGVNWTEAPQTGVLLAHVVRAGLARLGRTVASRRRARAPRGPR